MQLTLVHNLRGEHGFAIACSNLKRALASEGTFRNCPASATFFNCVSTVYSFRCLRCFGTSHPRIHTTSSTTVTSAAGSTTPLEAHLIPRHHYIKLGPTP